MRTDLAWRALLPAAALIAHAAGAPAPVVGALTLAGLALAAERLVRLRQTASADRVLVGVGGVLVTLVLTGIALDATGLGLRATTWVAALTVLSVTGLVAAAIIPERAPTTTEAHRKVTLLALPWVGLALVVAVVAVRMSAGSLSAATAEPVQLSLGQVSGSEVQVVVSSSEAVGPFEVRTSDGSNEISYPLFSIGADGTATTTLALPPSGRFVITLSYPDQTTPLRTLVLDR